MVVLFDEHGRRPLRDGVLALTEVVGRTLGPQSGIVMLGTDDGGLELLTSSGEVARRIVALPDRATSVGAMLLRHGLWRMHEQVGDGGAATAVVAQELVSAGCRHVAAGVDARRLRQGMERGVEAACAALQSQSEEIDVNACLPQVLRTACGDSDLVHLVAALFGELGAINNVVVREHMGVETSHRTVIGSRWPGTAVKSQLVSGGAGAPLTLTEPYVLVTDKSITKAAQLVGLLDKILGEDGGPLLVVAKDVSGSAHELLLANRAQGVIDAVSWRPEVDAHWRQELEDIAVATGARFLTDQFGDSLEAAGLDDLGYAQHVTISPEAIEIAGGAGDPSQIQDHSRALRRQLAAAADEDERGHLRRRIGNLSGKTAVLDVGAPTEAERAVRRQLADRLVRLATVALEGGAVLGGGVAFVRCQQALDAISCENPEEQLGVRLVRDALSAPLRQIARGRTEVLALVDESGSGRGGDAVNRHLMSMRKNGVLDATSVLRLALETAVSLAGAVLTTGAVVIRRKPEVSIEP